PTLVTAGKTFALTVTALDSSGRVDCRYNRTVTLGSSDPRFIPPTAYTFTPADMGSHTFFLTLKTGGPQTLNASDSRIAGTSGFVSVLPAAPDHLVFPQSPLASIVATPIPSLVIQLLDPFSNISTSTASVSVTIASGPAGGTFT